jgi:thiol-disulfide isomerase/thioredoxin
MNAEFLSRKFDSALDYNRYLASGTDEQRRRWQQVYDATKLTDQQSQLAGSFTRRMNLLVVSGIWCGDCVQQVPLMQRIAEANVSKIELRIVDRDVNSDLRDQVQMNAGHRVPVVIFMAEDFELCGIYGERTLARYRAIAKRQLGAACQTGIVPPDQNEMNATLGEWLNEIERIQLMLRLSPRLRQKHGD